MSQHWYDTKGELVNPGYPGAFPSATTILDVINKPELHAWRLRVGAEAATIKQQQSAARGISIHQLLSDFILDLLPPDYEAVDSDHKEAIRGFNNWKTKFEPSEFRSEVPVRSTKYKYAGTADIICRIGGELWVADLKTSRVLNPTYGLQLRAYEQALFEECGEHARMACLQLPVATKQGYRWKEYKEPLKVFIACKTLFDWQLKDLPIPAGFDGNLIHA